MFEGIVVMNIVEDFPENLCDSVFFWHCRQVRKIGGSTPVGFFGIFQNLGVCAVCVLN